MKRTCIRLALALSLMGGVSISSCKNKKNTDTTTTIPTTSADTNSKAPVEIAPDDQLTTGVKDATKDFPGVTATVNNGEVTLTGKIKTDRWRVLLQSLSSLHPKKINSDNLTIQP